jgi:hypothetical protein
MMSTVVCVCALGRYVLASIDAALVERRSARLQLPTGVRQEGLRRELHQQVRPPLPSCAFLLGQYFYLFIFIYMGYLF